MIARKRFGQHFLEPAWIAKVMAAIAPKPDDEFIEIGPGRAALTRPLAEAARHVTAFEIDRDRSSTKRICHYAANRHQLSFYRRPFVQSSSLLQNSSIRASFSNRPNSSIRRSSWNHLNVLNYLSFLIRPNVCPSTNRRSSSNPRSAPPYRR